MNKLFFGDNLEVMRDRIASESVDLVYLDPPFNSDARYNVLFRSADGKVAQAQAEAFRDTWTWDLEAERSFAAISQAGGGVASFVNALYTALGQSDLMAYLVMMAVRLHEIRRVMKPTASLYLHCDPTASHYLKVILDGIFGAQNFRNEITWLRSKNPKGSQHGINRFSPFTDTIFFYVKSVKAKFHADTVRRPLTEDEVRSKFPYADNYGPYADGPVLRSASMGARPNLVYEYKGFTPGAAGWRVRREELEKIDKAGNLAWTRTGAPRRKLRPQDVESNPIGDFWGDIPPLNSQAKERLGYPTQKPVQLLERILSASSMAGDVVLDPFCGCGTTVHAAEIGKRQWIGIDVAVHAIKVIEARLAKLPDCKFQLEGMPRDFSSALRLAESDKYQFQWWANYLFNPHALRDQKKGADRGIDGEVFFPNGPGRPWGKMLTSVKGGHVAPTMVRDFARVIDREKAEMGLFICLRRPTRAMTSEAVSAGFAPVVHGEIPRLQIVALEDWFEGRKPTLPPLEHLPSAALAPGQKKPQSARRADPLQPELPLSFAGGRVASGGKRYINHLMVDDDAAKTG